MFRIHLFCKCVHTGVETDLKPELKTKPSFDDFMKRE